MFSLVFFVLTFIICFVHTTDEDLITCDNVKDLQFGKFLWLDDRVHASEASFRGRPVVAIRPLMQGSWLSTHRKPEDKLRLLDWMKHQRDISKLVDTATAPHVYGGCWRYLESAVTVVELTERWLDACADDRLGAVERIRIASNALELVHYWNDYPGEAAESDDDDDDERRTNAAAQHLLVEGGRKVLLGDVSPDLFSVNGEYYAKLSLIQNMKAYQSKRFGNMQKCTIDADCRTFFFQKQKVMKALKHRPPDDFNCDLNLNYCRGLDWRTNLLAVCRTLIAPLFGVTASGALVNEPDRAILELPFDVRNGAANALRSCLSSEPDERPSPRELQKSLELLSQDLLPPFFIPTNAMDAVLPRDQNNMTELAEQLADYVEDPHAIAANRFKPVTLITDWAVKFVKGRRDSSLDAPPIQLTGISDNQPWVSTPIVTRESPHSLRSHTGAPYRLVGKPSCARLLRARFSPSLCAAFENGFPSDWRRLIDKEWTRMFAEDKSKHFTSQFDDDQPNKFQLEHIGREFEHTPSPTPWPTPIPTQLLSAPQPLPDKHKSKPIKQIVEKVESAPKTISADKAAIGSGCVESSSDSLRVKEVGKNAVEDGIRTKMRLRVTFARALTAKESVVVGVGHAPDSSLRRYAAVVRFANGFVEVARRTNVAHGTANAKLGDMDTPAARSFELTFNCRPSAGTCAVSLSMADSVVGERLTSGAPFLSGTEVPFGDGLHAFAVAQRNVDDQGIAVVCHID